MSQDRIVCPKCGRADAIRKVSSIVSAGTTQSETFGYGAARIDGETHFIDTRGYATISTGLANRLAPPHRPVKPTPLGCVSALLLSRVGLTSGALVFVLVVSACSFPLFASSYRESPLLPLLPILVFAAVAVRLFWWTGRSLVREVGNAAIERKEFPAEVKAWEHAMDRWRELYYCSRDDGVFLPQRTNLVPAANMKSLLFAKPKEKHNLSL
jgi:hypothetical protein